MVTEANPVLARRYRGGQLESLHRGCWVVADTDGAVVAGAGDPDQMIFPRSASKSLQGLGLLASGAVERFGLGPTHLAAAISSHNGEPIHEQVAGETLAAAGLDPTALLCGPASPYGDPRADKTRLRHGCSGKHAGFLAGAVALGQDPSTYLDPAGEIQQMVLQAAVAVCGLGDDEWRLAIDGCSAPTFVMPLRKLAAGIARVSNPDGLDPDTAAACRRLTDAAAAHPELIAGTEPPRFDTDLLAATDGRLFAKGGADGVQVIGVRGQGVALVGKVDDGNDRGLVPVAIEVLDRLGYLSVAERQAISRWVDPTIYNADRLEVGEQRLEPITIT